MKILITGGEGMLGRELTRCLSNHEVFAPGRSGLDVARAELLRASVRALRPQVILHTAAMTKVDACESDEDEALRANALGSANIAAAAAEVGARLIAFSTDYVFSGDLERPYHEWDATGPRTAYGRSKLAAEEAIARHASDALILRIAWLYGPAGPSFVHRMLELGAAEGPPLKVVADQWGNPTSTHAVARRVTELLEVPLVGTMHLTCEGEATWYEFAQEIFRRKGLRRGLSPCDTAEFPRPAPRPKNSRLEKRLLRLAGLRQMPDWRDALSAFLEEYPNG